MDRYEVRGGLGRGEKNLPAIDIELSSTSFSSHVARVTAVVAIVEHFLFFFFYSIISIQSLAVEYKFVWNGDENSTLLFECSSGEL